MDNFETLLILMVVIWLFGKIFRMMKLPIIFGELVGGIIVGPLVLNLVQPDNEVVKVLSEFGIFFLMLHSGLETDPAELFRASKKSMLIAVGGALLPFFGGYAVSIWFGQSFESALFIGMGLSITAIAISVRLFKDYKIQRSKVAHITLGAAIIDDIIALVLFSVVLSIAKQGHILWSDIGIMLAKVIAFFGIVLYVGHKTSKYFPKFLAKKGFTVTLIVALVLGLTAKAIGLHVILGAFIAGLFIREEIVEEKVYRKIEDRIYGLSYSFFGPIFFASLAFYLDFSALIIAPWFFVAILSVALFGKIIGAGGMALLQKMSWNDSCIIGIAMNSRGAVELIIASIGYQEGIIGKDVFSVLVLMAFATTLISIFSMKPFVKRMKQLAAPRN